jgi:hypothetical protein
MRRVSEISTPEEFVVEIRREALRELRLRRRAKATLLIFAGAAMVAEMVLHLPGAIPVSLNWL